VYIKKIPGPRTVMLPDGSFMSRADLPPPDTLRWVASRKAAVVKAVAAKLITAEQALKLYNLSQEELDSWCVAASKYGENGLKTTTLRKDRHLNE